MPSKTYFPYEEWPSEPVERLPSQEKIPDIKSGVRIKEASSGLEEDLLREKIVRIKGVIDSLKQIIRGVGDFKKLEPEVRWEIFEHLVVLSEFIGESEYPDDLAQQNAWTNALKEKFAPTKNDKMEMRLGIVTIKNIINEANSYIKKILKDLDEKKSSAKKVI